MRTLILLDAGRLAYATSEPLTEPEISAMKGHEHAAGAPTVYAFQADELIDHRSADPAQPRWAEGVRAAEAAEGLAELGRRSLTLGDPPELEAAWAKARAAYGLPDDGIAAWSLTLRETEGGWEAEAWRSDTTSENAVGPTAIAALEGLARRGEA